MHRMPVSSVIRPQEASHSIVPCVDDLQGHRRSQKPLPHQGSAQRRLGPVEDTEERQALLGLVRMYGCVVLVLEYLQRGESVCVDLHGVEEGQRLDVTYLETADTFVLELRDGTRTGEVVQEGTDAP